MYEYEYRVRHGSSLLCAAAARASHPCRSRRQRLLQGHHPAADPRCRRRPGAAFPPRLPPPGLGRRGLPARAAPCLPRPVPPGVDARPRRVLDHARERHQPGLLHRGRSSSPGRWRPSPCCPAPAGSAARPPLPLDHQLSRRAPPGTGGLPAGPDRPRQRRRPGSSCACSSCAWCGAPACGSTRRWAHEVPPPAVDILPRRRHGGARLPRELLLPALRVAPGARHRHRGACRHLLLHEHPRGLDAGRGARARRGLLPRRRRRSAW